MFQLQITCHDGRFFLLFQVSEFQGGLFKIDFEMPISGTLSLKYIADDAGPVIVKLWAIAEVLPYQLLISPYQLLDISDENLLMIPDKYFIATLISPAAKPKTLEEVRMVVENVEKILIHSYPDMELIAVSTIIGALK